MQSLSPVFTHLRASGKTIETRHGVPLTVRAPDTFRLLPAKDRVADFGGHPYQVSLAGFAGQHEAIMVHAEQVMDGSAASNYQDLPAANWPSPQFRYRSYCAAVTPELVQSEHDLGWLRSNGWDPVGNVAVAQYLATTPTFDKETVLSLVVKGVDCADKAAVEQAFAALRSKVDAR